MELAQVLGRARSRSPVNKDQEEEKETSRSSLWCFKAPVVVTTHRPWARQMLPERARAPVRPAIELLRHVREYALHRDVVVLLLQLPIDGADASRRPTMEPPADDLGENLLRGVTPRRLQPAPVVERRPTELGDRAVNRTQPFSARENTRSLLPCLPHTRSVKSILDLK